MHDGIYCLASDHRLYTTFQDALWETMIALYNIGYKNFTKQSDTTTKWQTHFVVSDFGHGPSGLSLLGHCRNMAVQHGRLSTPDGWHKGLSQRKQEYDS